MKDKNSKDLKSFIAGMAVGSVLIGGGVYAATVSAANVSYNNSSSGLAADNIQSAVNSLNSKVSTASATNNELTYFKYYNECHTNTVNGINFGSCGLKDVVSVFSCFNYARIIYNLKGTSTSLTGSNCSNKVSTCCQKKCRATSGTCYTKCSGGYDSYYDNSF